MWFLILLLSFVVVSALAFVVEVVCIIAKSETRPSTLIAALGTNLSLLYEKAVYFLVLATDITKFIKRFVIVLRDLCFRFIPREVFIEAYNGLRTANRILWLAPLGALRGLSHGLAEVSSPVLALIVVALCALITPVALELVFVSTGSETRFSGMVHIVAVWLYEAGQQLGLMSHYVTHIKDLVVQITSFLFGWIPTEVIKEATTTVYSTLYQLLVYPTRGIATGICKAFFDDPNDTHCSFTRGNYALPQWVFAFWTLFILWVLLFVCAKRLHAWIPLQWYGVNPVIADPVAADGNSRRRVAAAEHVA